MTRPKLFRDPVHGDIPFDLDHPAEALLFQLICSRPFQRLRRIRQLGLANFVFQGAEHSRFQHSIGVAHIARRIGYKLRLSVEECVEVFCAALLHDIGHGPFSHAIEHVTHVDHEEFTRGMILDPDTEVHKILATYDSHLPDRIARYFEKRTDFPSEKYVLRDVVSSQLDADRMDYLQRDSHATGVRAGLFDVERIHAMLTRAEIDGVTRLAVNVRAREAVEGYLIARAHMYKQVYLHKSVRSAENMLLATLKLGREYLVEFPEESRKLHPTFVNLLKGETISPHEYVSLDDNDVWTAIKLWADGRNKTLAELSASLLDRRLFKTYNIDVTDDISAGRLSERARRIAVAKGLNPDYSVWVDYAQDTPYRPYSPDRVSHPTHICLVDDDGNHVPIEEVSAMARLLGYETYKITRLIVHPSIRPELDQVIRVIGGVKRW